MMTIDKSTTNSYDIRLAPVLKYIVASGVTDPKTAFEQNVSNAKLLGLMPDDQKVIKKTLADFGFVMQGAAMEGIPLEKALLTVADIGSSAVVFADILTGASTSMLITAFNVDDGKYQHVSESYRDNFLKSRIIRHIWVRWNDGIDRGSCPRRKVNRKTSKASKKRVYPETDCYKPYQPNPCDNYIGDCVVRALSGTMNISWEDAIEMLSSSNSTKINYDEVYAEIFKKNGFVHHKPIVREGHRLTGQEFCNEMQRKCYHGERIFAHIGRSHVVAIVPVNQDNGAAVYKIIDCWNSSGGRVGEYWVYIPDETGKGKTSNEKESTLYIGNRIIHPSFGEGTISATSDGIVTIDFKSNGLRRLSEAWVMENCIVAN